MIAVDTNIIVRLIVGDDGRQVERAMALAEREIFYVSFTVVAETEWVLRSRYGFDRRRTVSALRQLSGLVRLRYEDDDDLEWALDRFEQRGELADYLHIAAARMIGRFASFEAGLARRAGEFAPARVELP